VGIQEIAFRWVLPVPEVRSFNRINYSLLHVYHTRLFEVRRKGLSNVKILWESEPDGFAFEHTLNLYGFRGPDFKIEPNTGRRRVVFVGDSYVEGCGAADADTLPEQFQHVLGEGHPVEAINLGVLAIGFPEYVRIVRDSVPLLHPETVFLVTCWNDFPAPPLNEDETRAAAQFERLNPWVPRAVQAIGLLREGMAVPRRWPSGPYPCFEAVPVRSNPLSAGLPPRAIEPSILRAMERGKLNPWLWTSADMNNRVLEANFPKTGGIGRHLAYLADVCRAQGSRLIVVYIPYHVATNDAYAAVQKNVLALPPDALLTLAHKVHDLQCSHLVEVTRSLNIPFLDTTEAFVQAEQTQGHVFWPVDGHCTAAGYRLIADACARCWIDQGTAQPVDEPSRAIRH
jgi:lysophospholipase L1-like esterase